MKDKEFFNNVAEKWDNMCCHKEEKILYILDKADIKRGSSVLDIGSGTGVMIPYIESELEEDGQVTALDIAEKMLEVSKRKHKYRNLNFINQDFLYYNTEEHYDIIMAYSCYPHFHNKKLFFQKAYELLNPEGKLIIAHSESKEAINGRHGDIEDKLKSNKLGDIKDLADIAAKNGFRDIFKEDSDEYYIYIGGKKV
ncbi:class I SAM-dependent DNA methyltransferase [Clostridium polynesiense]|uniref:class I SAM-dependent DNA methyltransferase n=1 Tax=Clostridium polynesiense TaxID=1325933 RepID=UPI000590FA9B|nr:class I SAM-dependent methyltransferase [Clostridium polynesiense]